MRGYKAKTLRRIAETLSKHDTTPKYKKTNVTSKAYVSPLGSLMTYTTHTLVNMSEYSLLYKSMKRDLR